MRSTLPLRGERFKCGHAKTLDNVTYRRKHRDEPYAPCCKTCAALHNEKARVQYHARKPTPVRWISAPNLAEIIAECRPRYLREIEPKKPTGRPRKTLNVRAA